MKKNCLNWFLSAAFLFLLGSCANKVKPGQEPEVKEKFTFAYFTDVHLNKDNRGNGDVALRMACLTQRTKGWTLFCLEEIMRIPMLWEMQSTRQILCMNVSSRL